MRAASWARLLISSTASLFARSRFTPISLASFAIFVSADMPLSASTLSGASGSASSIFSACALAMPLRRWAVCAPYRAAAARCMLMSVNALARSFTICCRAIGNSAICSAIRRDRVSASAFSSANLRKGFSPLGNSALFGFILRRIDDSLTPNSVASELIDSPSIR